MLADRILFIDGEAIIVDKPAGLPVDPPRDGSLSVENHLDSLRFGFQRWPTPVHRLDRDTSGCLLLARNPKSHKRFQQAFEQGHVAKRYLAILDGVPDGTEGVIDIALGKHSTKEAGWRIVADPRGKPARTRWQLIATEHGRALVRFEPETGRTHQIRAHAALGLGAPIMGDAIYGRAGPKGQGMLLHAAFLSVARDGKPSAEAHAPVPDRFLAAGFPAEAFASASVRDPIDAAA